MNTENGSENFVMGFGSALDPTGFDEGAKHIEQTISKLGQSVDTEGQKMSAAFSKIGVGVAAYFSVQQIESFAQSVIKVRGEIESLEISFETLLGSKDAANELFGAIREFAVNTPMQLNTLASGAQTLLGFGISAEKVMPIMEQIGDISMGDAQKFQSLTLAFAQASSAGKLMGQDFLQMVNAGFNPLNELSATTGKSIKQLKEDMENGKITTKELEAAFASATAEGGKFHGMLEKQSKGIQGSLSNLQGAWDDMLNEIGSKQQSVFVDGVNALTNLVKNYETLIDVIAGLVIAYGSYKAALMAVSAAEKVKAAGEYEIEAAGLQKVIALKNEDVIASGKQVAAESSILSEKQVKIAAMKAEAMQYLESLKLQEASIKQNYNDATSAAAAAAIKLEAAKEESAAALQAANALSVHAAQEVKDAAETRVNTAAVQERAAAAELEAARQNVSTIAVQKDSVQKQINTVETELNGIAERKNAQASSLLTAAKVALRKAQLALNASMLASPVFWIAAAIAAVTFAIYKLATADSAAEKAQKKLNDAHQEFHDKLEKERNEVERLIGIIQDENQTEFQKIAAYNQLKSLIPELTDAYSREELQVAALAETQKKLNELQDAKTYQNAVANLEKYTQMLGVAKNWGSTFYTLSEENQKEMRDQFGRMITQKDIDELQAIVDGYKKQVEELQEMKRKAEYDSLPVETKLQLAIDERDSVKKELDRVKSEIDRQEKELQDKVKDNPWIIYIPSYLKIQEQKLEGQVSDLDAKISGMQQKKTTFDEDYKAAKVNWEKAKKALDEVNKDRKKYTKEQYQQRKEDEEKYRKEFEALGGDTDVNKAREKAKKEKQELADAAAERSANVRKYAERLKVENMEAEIEIRDAEISTMDEGFEKQMKAIDLNYDRLILENEKRQAEMVERLREARINEWRIQNPKATKEDEIAFGETITEKDLSPEQQAQIKAYAELAAKIRKKAESDALKEMLYDYESYESKRALITETYAKKEQELQAALDKRNEDGSMFLAEGSKERQAVEKAILILQKQQGEELLDLESEYSQLNLLEKEREKIEKQLKIAISEGNTDEAEKLASELKKIIKQINDIEKQIEDATAFDVINNNVKDTEKKILKSLKGLSKEASANLEGIIKKVAELADLEVGDFLANLSNADGLEGLEKVVDLIKSAELGGFAGIFGFITKSFIEDYNKNGERLQKILTAQRDVLNQMAQQHYDELLAGKSGIFGEDTLAGIEQYVKVLDEVKYRQEYLKQMALGWDIDSWLKYLESHPDTTQGSGDLENYRVRTKNRGFFGELLNGGDEWTSYKDLAEQFGMEMYDEYGNFSAEFAQMILDTYGEELSEVDKEFLEGVIRDGEAYKEAMENIAIYLEDLFGNVADTIADNFINSFLESGEAAADFGDVISDVSKQMVKDLIKTKILAALDPFTEEINNIMASDMEQDEKVAQIMAVFASMQGVMDGLAPDIQAILEGYKQFFDMGESGREGMQKGIAAASQDSVDENNARLTTIQGHTYSIVQGLDELNLTANEILAKVTGIEANTSETNSKLDNMNSRVRNIESTVDEIQRNGIKLKS